MNYACLNRFCQSFELRDRAAAYVKAFYIRAISALRPLARAGVDQAIISGRLEQIVTVTK